MSKYSIHSQFHHKFQIFLRNIFPLLFSREKRKVNKWCQSYMCKVVIKLPEKLRKSQKVNIVNSIVKLVTMTYFCKQSCFSSRVESFWIRIQKPISLVCMRLRLKVYVDPWSKNTVVKHGDQSEVLFGDNFDINCPVSKVFQTFKFTSTDGQRTCWWH